ncbi:MAG: hypothetical protein A2087_07160 [Spirochaetes bacterium GWD1_61_31]|nr:MAG: hypothetical protein A2Y37_08310 [Spirochaetes bacterium GWB1_60_80]OHD34197.1 MAG: hypothetical protein A2004_12430 [Spirochaetes bacterium GWC1_61_12]OHD40124.1 MAG: hypothetical protein A2087_07160 [Spirochaetes bacterium GWD1_61_31]OHD45828.1 MAG: hypothetical protein A2Y35_03945 [Spirochaetes bacterium GWE1_60_18]OHD58371.1 MAG: hypothetical protein A2Y32_06335 [Spirochaetes bacterium GWF1_60_12]HAW86516.1 hypothetical protein [Spirochaetaceae bacterium]
MRKIVLLVLFSCLLALLHAQSLEELIAVNVKPVCTMTDFSIMLPAFLESLGGDDALRARLAALVERYSGDDLLTKGRLSLLAARAVRLQSSFFFLILPIERYAFRLLVAETVFSNTSSAGDIVSGLELIDFIARFGQLYGVVDGAIE